MHRSYSLVRPLFRLATDGIITSFCSKCRANCAPTHKHAVIRRCQDWITCVTTKDNSKLHGGWETAVRIPGNERTVGSFYIISTFWPQSTLKGRHIIYSPSLFLVSSFSSFWTLITVRTGGWMETVLSQGHATHRYPSQDISVW